MLKFFILIVYLRSNCYVKTFNLIIVYLRFNCHIKMFILMIVYLRFFIMLFMEAQYLYISPILLPICFFHSIVNIFNSVYRCILNMHDIVVQYLANFSFTGPRIVVSTYSKKIWKVCAYNFVQTTIINVCLL